MFPVKIMFRNFKTLSRAISGKHYPVSGPILDFKKPDYPAGYPVHPYNLG